MTPEARFAEMQSYLSYSQLQWPQIRANNTDRIAKRCSRCVISEKYTTLENGLCSACTAQQTRQQKIHTQANNEPGSEALEDVLLSHEGKGRGSHDALLLFSGGKDSTYLLHKLLQEYPKLRLLAVMVDNGFSSPIALQNVKRVFERLDVDHMVFKPRKSLFRKAFRHALKNLNPEGCYTTVDRMDGDLIFDIGRNLTARMDIPLMIAAMSPVQLEKVFGLNDFESPREQEVRRRTHSAGFKLEDLYTPEELNWWWDGTAWTEDRVPRVLYPFKAWPYDEAWISEEVVRLGLLESGGQNPLATNNETIPVMLALDMCVLGYSGFEPEFAQLIREGKADRDAWLNIWETIEFLSKQGKFLPECIDDTLSKLDLTRSELGMA